MPWMGEPFGWEGFERTRRAPPDQDQRLRRDEHGLGPHRRARAWIVVVLALVLVAAFVAIVASGGGEGSFRSGSDVGIGVDVDDPTR